MVENNKGPIAAACATEPAGLAGAVPSDCVAVFLYSPFPSREAALAVARALVEAKAAGCVNILPAMTSVYVWNGAVEVADEAVLIAKLPASAVERAAAMICQMHSYEKPAVLVLPVVQGNPDYLDWLRSGTEAMG